MGKSRKDGKLDLPRRAAVPDGARRRLLQGGLGAAPLLTLVSRPVLGSVQCVRGSAYDSIPASGQGRQQFCSGRSPGYWKQAHHFAAWPAPYIPGSLPKEGEGGEDNPKANPKGAVFESVVAKRDASTNPGATPFNAVFSPSPYAPSVTLLDVLELGGGPPNDVGRHIVAALLNAAAYLTPVLKVQEVQTIWREYATRGYYEPTAGIKWYHREIVDYLESTMSL